MSDLFNALRDRPTAHALGRCVMPPIGCGQPITTFKDSLSQREYAISALCQTCQDKVFTEEFDEDDRSFDEETE